MNENRTTQNERIVDVREISRGVRHTVIHQLFDNLNPEQTLQLIVDHDPRPLKLQLEARHGLRVVWDYLEHGPDVWRVRISRGSPA